MSYVALYRKFRPQTFEDVKGQDAIVTTFKNQIKSGRIGHAYLFSGTRGTGKTTVAKIVAKAVNCEHPVDGSPCGECPSCRAIAAGTSMNVIEIDAASNNGVEDIRQIREEVSYAPTDGKYKVYIIDEVHMLSKGAYNALLKTLEEPPAYVIFILATTEEQKIPITILSRCQRYNFKRIASSTIEARLSDLLKQEGVEAEEKAVAYVAKAGDGSMRDALSLLDQCIAFYYGEPLTYEHVLEVLGAVDNTVFSNLLNAVLAQNVDRTMQIFSEVVNEGREITQFVTEFTWYLRNLLVAKTADHMEDLLEMSEENMALLKEEAEKISYEDLLRYIRILSELGNEIRYASSKRVLAETVLIKLCRPQMEEDYESLAARLHALEEKLERGEFVSASAAGNGAAGSAKKPTVPEENLVPAASIRPEALAEDVALVRNNWNSISKELPAIMSRYLREARLDFGDNEKLHLFLADTMALGYFSRPENVAALEDAISGVVEKIIHVKVDPLAQHTDTPLTKMEDIMASVIHMEIEEED